VAHSQAGFTNFPIGSHILYLSYALLLQLGPLPSIMHFTLKMEAAKSSKTMVSYHSTMQHHNPEELKLNESVTNSKLLGHITE